MRKLTLLLTVPAVLALLMAGCGEAGTGAGEPTVPPDGVWVLVEGTGPDGPIALVDGHVPTLTIDGEEWGGTVCNHYFTTARLDGQRVTIEGVGATEMACLAEGAMESESAYHAALSRVERHGRGGDQLVLEGPEVELVYDPVRPETNAALEGTVWRLDAIVAGPGPDGAVSSVLDEPSLELDGGRLGGETGCNGFGGSYELQDDRLVVEELERTLIGCDEAHRRQEDDVIAVLEAGPTVRVDGATLDLTAPDGRGLRYRADPAG
jgi:heat shock protein HslJ